MLPAHRWALTLLPPPGTSTLCTPISQPLCSAPPVAPGTPRPQAPALLVPAPEPWAQCGSLQPTQGGLLGAAAMPVPMHGDKPLSPPWHLGRPAGRWHPMHTSTPGPGSAGDTPRSPQPHTMAHPRDAAPPKRQRWVGCSRLAPFSPITTPVPGQTWERRAGTGQGSSRAPGASRDRRKAQLDQQPGRAGAGTCTAPSLRSRLRTSLGLCHQHPAPAWWPSLAPRDHQPSPTVARGLQEPGRMPKGDEPPPAPRSPRHHRPLGAAGGLHRAAPRPVLPPRGTAGAPGVARWEMQ